jgi:4-hydroxyphenylpyruvate dioxygenase
MVPSIVTAPGDAANGDSRRIDSSASANVDGYRAFDHILWYVGNAKQAASYYVTRMGFKHVAYVLQPRLLPC